MKNKENDKPKQKEFSVSPFKALKGKAIEVREQVASAPPVKKAPEPAAVPDDDLLFWEAFADVKRLNPSPAAAPMRAKVQEVKEQRESDDQRTFLQAVEALKMDLRFSEEEEEPVPRPTSVNRLRQVRRGGIRVDFELDLHGLTKDEALENLERFVVGAYNRGQKGVLVITGKGNNSPGEPVLRTAVAAWLRDAGKGMVVEFVQAPKELGGGGAFVVFLREKKEPEQG
jgi:DNA-nicking Smr family endonuclease